MNNKTVGLAQAGVIAALYVALTMAIQPLSFGAIQFRLSEVLTILPVCFPSAVPGLMVGCFLANLLGLASGANPAGAWDLLIGTVATGSAAVLTRLLREVRVKRFPVWATVPPVIINGVLVGGELYVMYGGMPWWLHMMWVTVGQIGPCVIGGLLLCWALEKTNAVRKMK